LSVEDKRGRRGVPKYFYWGRKSPLPKQSKSMNKQQKSFSRIVITLRVIKVVAVLAMILLILYRL
jgi:hypothetical protein